MSTIVTRAGKGSALTHNEVDANFVNLNTDKIQSGDTVSSLTITNLSGTTVTYTNANISSATISGGTITGITDLNVADGGTGRSSLTSNNVLLGNGTSSVNFVAPGANGNVLTSDGTTWTSAAASSSGFPSGTLMLFQQTSAPTGWTKQTTHNDKALRVVSGAASSGGSVAFTTAFASKSVSGTVGGTTLTVTQIPAHSHSVRRFSSGSTGNTVAGSTSSATTVTANPVTTDTGGGSSHDHTFTGTSIDLDVQYVDLIIASKD
jgi:hypothetical protein